MKPLWIIPILCLTLTACGANQTTPAPTAVEFQPVSTEIAQATNTPTPTSAPTAETPLASFFHILTGNLSSLDKANAVTPSNGTATLTYTPGDMVYVCTDLTHADVLNNIVIASLATPDVLAVHAKVDFGDWKCNEYGNITYTGSQNTLSVGTPTVAASIATPSLFNLILEMTPDTSAPETQPPEDQEPKDWNTDGGDGDG
ncbi:MAG: hypothetical protein HYZ24_16705 [Chloroflexi bacterium]|nr:hypothetical protein [Chloroflexota bacterium]